MDHRIYQLQNYPLTLTQPKKAVQAKPLTSFKEAFQEVSSLKISKHAQKRLDERNIQIERSKWSQIEERIIEAREKGINDSLVIMNDSALIVNAKNRTVITALDRTEATAQIFTNINGAILID